MVEGFKNEEFEETVEDIRSASMEGAKVILVETDLKTLLKRSNLLPMRDFRRMIIDVEDATGNINIGGAWLFSERLIGAIDDDYERELILVAGGQYRQQDRKVRPVIQVCAALAVEDFTVKKAVKFDGDGTVVHGASLKDRELCSCLSALSSAVRNPAVYSKQTSERRDG